MTGDNLKNEKGVSLIELLVAVTLFAFLILAAAGIFKMVVDGQRNAISAQNIQENMRYALEKMSKEIRMAQISNTECLSTAVKKVFNITTDINDNNKLYFKNQYGACVTYYLENNRLKVISGINSDFVTPDKIQVSNLRFYAVDDLIGAFHSTQPYVTMAMDIKAAGLALHEQKMKIQITVSSRYYE
ncbi:MAG: prepilin-type N-terminal cleavage/methylation domain-containing protein [bacterium]|nr:prepilin-type N-terminal cleavage/methylation domain-containing protein [bacterium]